MSNLGRMGCARDGAGVIARFLWMSIRPVLGKARIDIYFKEILTGKKNRRGVSKIEERDKNNRSKTKAECKRDKAKREVHMDGWMIEWF